MTDYAVILLPFPPSTNGLFAGKDRRYKSKAYVNWLGEADYAMIQQRPYPRFKGKVRLNMRLGPGQANADCTNYIKAAEDLLVRYQVIQDDSRDFVSGVSIDWDMSVNGIQIEIIRCDDSQNDLPGADGA